MKSSVVWPLKFGEKKYLWKSIIFLICVEIENEMLSWVSCKNVFCKVCQINLNLTKVDLENHNFEESWKKLETAFYKKNKIKFLRNCSF